MDTTLKKKLDDVRYEAVSTIKDFFIKNNLDCIDLIELSKGCTPVVTPERTLDYVKFNKKANEFTFEASGEYDNEFYCLEAVSTDCLVDLVEIIELNENDILYMGK